MARIPTSKMYVVCTLYAADACAGILLLVKLLLSCFSGGGSAGKQFQLVEGTVVGPAETYVANMSAALLLLLLLCTFD